MRLRPLLFVIVLSLALLGVAQSAPAQVAGEKEGVTVVRGSHGHVFRFAKRAANVYRRIAGRGRGRGFVVALDGPDASPPAGKLGYWTDGVRSVTAMLTAAGRRLFIDIERDVVRTNALPYLTADD